MFARAVPTGGEPTSRPPYNESRNPKLRGPKLDRLDFRTWRRGHVRIFERRSIRRRQILAVQVSAESSQPQGRRIPVGPRVIARARTGSRATLASSFPGVVALACWMVVEGMLEIDLDEGTVTVGPGQAYRVARGVRPRTRARVRTVNLCFERSSAQTVFDN
jgi:hypothetical protein